MAVSETLRESLRALRCSAILAECERLEDDPGAEGMTRTEYLEHLVQHELKTREVRGIEGRIREAGFPEIHRIEEFNFKRVPDVDERQIQELHGCDWIKRGENVVFCGGHGLGKTHLATSIGVAACEAGYRVLFRKADKLVLELLEAREERKVLWLRAKLQRVSVLIVD